MARPDPVASATSALSRLLVLFGACPHAPAQFAMSRAVQIAVVALGAMLVLCR